MKSPPGSGKPKPELETGIWAHVNYEKLKDILLQNAEQLTSEQLPERLEPQFPIPDARLPRRFWPIIDRVDWDKAEVIEIKPDHLYEDGLAEAKMYADLMNRFVKRADGKKWTPRCVTYDQNKVMKFLSDKGYLEQLKRRRRPTGRVTTRPPEAKAPPSKGKRPSNVPKAAPKGTAPGEEPHVDVPAVPKAAPKGTAPGEEPHVDVPAAPKAAPKGTAPGEEPHVDVPAVPKAAPKGTAPGEEPHVDVPAVPKAAPKGTAPGEEPHVDVPAGGRAAAAATALSIFLLLGQLIPDPNEQKAIQGGLDARLAEPASQSKLKELERQATTAQGLQYYVIEFKVSYAVTQHWHWRATPMYTVQNVEIVSLAIGKENVSRAGKLDPPGRPEGLQPAPNAGPYTWKASRQYTVSTLVPRPEIGPTYGLEGDTQIREAVAAADAATLARIPIGERVRITRRLFAGWVSDEDIDAIIRVYKNAPSDQRPDLWKVIEELIPTLTSPGQRIQLHSRLTR